MTEHLPPLPAHLNQRGSSPDLVMKEYLHVITDAIVNQPRSLQKKIGPSEIGAPCARRLGYKLLDIPEKDQAPNWKATMGTGAHMWLETAFDRNNLAVAENGIERWLIETRVNVGEAAGIEITGSCDLYDRWTGTVIDHKTVGPTQLKKYRANGPGQQYRTQAHLYGRGWQRAGLPVTTVAVAFLPRNGDLDEAYLWHEPYDEQIAIDGLQRLAGIIYATNALGVQALTHLNTADQYCHSCPWFKTGSTDLGTGCPGHPTAAANHDSSNQLTGLVA